MLKWLLWALLVANVGLFAWAQGWLGLPAPDQSQREPWRLQRQVQPGSITLLSATQAGGTSASTAAASAAPAAPTLSQAVEAPAASSSAPPTPASPSLPSAPTVSAPAR